MGWNSDTGKHEWGYESDADYWHRQKGLKRASGGGGGKGGCGVIIFFAGLLALCELYKYLTAFFS